MKEEINQEIKQFLKDNLIINVKYENNYGSGQNQVVSLRFLDDDEPFTEETIYIKDDQ